MDLSLVIPIYNEAENIPLLINAITKSLNNTNLVYEIICVDDGSQDGSTEVLKKIF